MGGKPHSEKNKHAQASPDALVGVSWEGTYLAKIPTELHQIISSYLHRKKVGTLKKDLGYKIKSQFQLAQPVFDIKSVAANPADGYIFLGDWNNRILVYPPDHHPDGSTPPSHIYEIRDTKDHSTHPCSMTFDIKRNNLVILEWNPPIVQIWKYCGKGKLKFQSKWAVQPDKKFKPTLFTGGGSIVVDTYGNFLITITRFSGIGCFTPKGVCLKMIGVELDGRGCGGTLAIDNQGKILFGRYHEVIVFGTDGSFLRIFDLVDNVVAASMDVDSQGMLVFGAEKLVFYSMDGKMVQEGLPPVLPGTENEYHVLPLILENGDLLVYDGATKRVLILG